MLFFRDVMLSLNVKRNGPNFSVFTGLLLLFTAIYHRSKEKGEEQISPLLPQFYSDSVSPSAAVSEASTTAFSASVFFFSSRHCFM